LAGSNSPPYTDLGTAATNIPTTINIANA